MSSYAALMEGGKPDSAQERVLSFLREFKAKKIEFDIEEASSKLLIPREEVERALFSLQRDGYLRILRIPPSEAVLEEVRRKLRELDGLFLAGEISASDYLKKWEEITGITDVKMDPMPSIDMKVLIDGLNNIFSYLEKLNEVNVSASVRKKLMEDYNREIGPLADGLRRISEASISYLKGVEEKLGKMHEELELIEADSRIRGTDREEDLKGLMGRIESVLRGVDSIIKRLNLSAPEEVDLKELENEVKKLEEERDLMRARLLIEGGAADWVKKRIESIEGRISELRATMERKKDEKKDYLSYIRERMSSLHEKGVLEDKIYRIL
jgi:hypothetical protein